MKRYYIIALTACSFIGNLSAALKSNTPLIKATIANDSEQVSRLLGLSFDAIHRPHQRVDILEKDECGCTAHMHAVSLKDTRVFDILAAQTCFSQYQYMVDANNSSILHYAAACGNEFAVRKLLYAISRCPMLRIYLLCPNNQGKTPKKLAQEKGHTAIVNLFS